MRTATFKIKINTDNYPIVLTCIHCPLEVFYESVKITPELKQVIESSDSKIYVTASDYIDDEGAYINGDYVFCSDIKDLLKSSSLCEFLKSDSCFGYLTAQSNIFDLFDENFNFKKEVNDEV